VPVASIGAGVAASRAIRLRAGGVHGSSCAGVRKRAARALAGGALFWRGAQSEVKPARAGLAGAESRRWGTCRVRLSRDLTRFRPAECTIDTEECGAARARVREPSPGRRSPVGRCPRAGSAGADVPFRACVITSWTARTTATRLVSPKDINVPAHGWRACGAATGLSRGQAAGFSRMPRSRLHGLSATAGVHRPADVLDTGGS